MSNLKYVKFENVSLKNHPKFNEKWLQDRIADDPSMLGLGDLILKDRERMQPKAGRLDLLLQDFENRRFEVELKLGATDESHIIRTIEYWDIERKRYPQYDHTGVIIAEDITSRFLNVISLFNGFISIVGIQLQAVKLHDQISLIFTTVLDQISLGFDEEDEEKEATDRSYWEKRGSPLTVSMADKIFDGIKSFDQSFDLKYNKFYIGLTQNGQTNNFAIFRPRKKALRLEIRMQRSNEIENTITEKGFDLMDYNKAGRYRIRLTEDDLNNHQEYIIELLKLAYS